MNWDNNLPRTLSIGSIADPGPGNRGWRDAIHRVSNAVDDAQTSDPTALNLNVVFHCPGRLVSPDFSGVRTGSYSKANNELMVQVALPEPEPEDPEKFVREALMSAIDEAERWARRREVAADLNDHRAIVAAAGN